MKAFPTPSVIVPFFRIITLFIGTTILLTVSAQAATSKVQTQKVLPVEEEAEAPAPGIPLDALEEEEQPLSDASLPIMRDLSVLPEPVRQTHQKLLDAALEGDIEKLRPLLGAGDASTNLSFGGLEGDPIAFLKETSGDKEGHEILAILAELLEAGFVQMDAGNENETYVWPYFFAWPLDELNPQQRVELFRILTAGDLEDSQSFGGYIFYRVGIRPDGHWSFFLAGD